MSKYLLKYITDHASPAYKEILQRKIIRGIQKAPHARTLPPTLLEWRTTKQRCNMALPLTLPDGTVNTVVADSWTTCQEAASQAISSLNIAPEGFTISLDDAGIITDLSGLDFIFDLISDMELSPGFPMPKTPSLKAGVRHSHPTEIEHHLSSPQSPAPRPQVPPPEPPSGISRRISKEVSSSRQSSPVNGGMNNQNMMSSHSSSRKTSRDTLNEGRDEYSPQRDSPRMVITSTPAIRKSSHEALSRNSALNERYFDIEKVRSRSLDNLLSEPEPTQLTDLGLSQSRLNDRYHSVEQLAPIKPVLATTNYKPQAEMEFEYPDVSSISTSNRGGPRYIKSQYSGKKAPPGSHSSKAQIEKSEFHVRSSAMSDTSEAPSLASHVRRVRVPSQASDVDQFLDELFSPVLDGNLDELSDARSLAASIKGGKRHKPEATDIDDYIEDVLDQITINENMTVESLVKQLKGGGQTTHQANGNNNSNYNNFSSMPNPIVTSPQSLMMLNSPTNEGYSGMHYQMQGGGMSLPPTGEIAAYQQNLQRAFLQSAMAQNIQIQQQLLAQNQALQQLLTQSTDEATSPPATSPTQKGAFSKNPARKTSSPNDYKLRKSSNESSISALSRAVNGVPPPPPMPPPLDGVDPSETRPFLDPYGRAKTVRIGKWRWPPPKDGTNVENGEDFIHFKLRQSQQRKVTPVANGQNHNGHSPSSPNAAEWEDMEFEPIVQHNERNAKISSSRRSFDVGANRPSPGSVGKLKLSSEMRQRLEQVTANHSVRSTSSKQDKPARVINKLEDTRKMMLEQQLGGRWGDNMEENLPNSGPPSPILISQRNNAKSPTQASWASSGWKPGPPPPPVGPQTLPPAPSSPAPPPPIRPMNQDSYITQRQDRDTFGVHQNRAGMKTSFSANWDLNSSTVASQDNIDMQGQGHWNNGGNASPDQVDHHAQVKRMMGGDSQGGDSRPTFRTHQYSKTVEKEREKKSSVSTQDTERDKMDEWPEFMRPIKTPPPSHPSPTIPKSPAQRNTPSPKTASSRLVPLGAAASVTYSRVPWQLRVRKEVYSPLETLGTSPGALHIVFCQVVMDVYGTTACIRLNQSEKRAGITMLSGFGVTAENFNAQHRANVKRNIIELARTWPLYFARLFNVTGAAQLADVNYIAVSHWGLHFVNRREVPVPGTNGTTAHTQLQVIKSFPHTEIVNCSAPRPTNVIIETMRTGRLTLHALRAQQVSEMVMRYGGECRKLQSKLAHSNQSINPSSPHQMRPIPSGTTHPESPSTPINNLPLGVHPPSSNINQQHNMIMENGVTGNVPRPISLPGMMGRENIRREQAGSPTTPGSPVPHQGRFSLLQYAMEYFRQSSDLDLLKMDSSIKSKEKRNEWTWKQQTDLVKWQPHPIDGSLLRLDDPDLGPLAVECFECILRYCGDMPLTPEMSEVKCVYTVLMHCHKHMPLRDEVYCQLMKQTTSNKADTPESAQRAWRLLSIVAAYFGCSDTLGPFLLEHLSSAASDRRRICHGTAVVCLANLRKTQRCGGRKNVPSVEEVTAVSAGRSARRQIYRLPGGAERVVNTRCSTVVNDVIAELCTLIGVASEAEQQEFSLYCIVQGDAFTMPLSADEYILDVTTELHKAAQPFYLIFCRSVWYHPLKLDASPLYTEVLFNQVAPDYLEGLLLRLGNPNLPPSIVRDMSLVAALLHRAADLNHSPTLKEVKFLLPKPVLGLREPRPPQWLALVQTSWGQAASIPVARAKHRVLQVLSNWQLFGSSFFAVKRVLSGDVDKWQEHILALNRSGVHFLDLTSHETLHHWPFAEVISTRKVRSEDGALFLDMKCGNLLQQRVTRLQTEQAHEISRLVRQYITLEQTNSTRSPQ